MKSYFAYVRVSTAKQGEGSSLQEQQSAIKSYAMRQNLRIVAWFEEMETAAKQGRAVFSRMLAQLEQGAAQGLIVHKIDRSARNLKDWANLGTLIDRGIDVHFAHDNVDLRSRGGRLSADIQAVVAADFIRNLREETRKGFYGRLKQGIYPLAAPVGYLDRGRGKPKDIDPVAGPLVRHAFERYASGTVSLDSLRAELATLGLLSTRTLRPISLNGISKMLNNPFYTGLIALKRTNESFRGIHEPLIPQSLFNRVQSVLKGNYAARTYKHDFLFRLTIRCSGCQCHLIGERQKQVHIYYRCHECIGVVLRERDIDHSFQMLLQFLRMNDQEQRALKALAAEMGEAAEGATERLRVQLRFRLAKLEERLDRLADAYAEGALDRALFERRKQACLKEQLEAEEQLDELSRNDVLQQALSFLELGNAALVSYQIGFAAEKRDLLFSLTSNAEAHGKNLRIALKSPYQEMVEWRKLADCDQSQPDARTVATKLLDIAIAVAKEERNAAMKATRSATSRRDAH